MSAQTLILLPLDSMLNHEAARVSHINPTLTLLVSLTLGFPSHAPRDPLAIAFEAVLSAC